jgi:hypothetical protein
MGTIAASIVVGYVGSFIAFWLLFRLLSLYPDKEILRLISAVFLVGAVSGIHYTGLSAAEFIFDDHHNSLFDTDLKTSGKMMYYITIASSICASVCITMLALADLRTWMINLSIRVIKADKIINEVKPAPGSSLDRAILKYKKKYHEGHNGLKIKAMYHNNSDSCTVDSRGSISSSVAPTCSSPTVVPICRDYTDAEMGIIGNEVEELSSVSIRGDDHDEQKTTTMN